MARRVVAMVVAACLAAMAATTMWRELDVATAMVVAVGFDTV